MSTAPPKVSILYMAPWVDYGGSDKGTIDWFRHLDRERFATTLVTTQPSENRRLHEIAEFAEEIWTLPDLVDGRYMPRAVFDLIATREIDVVHIMNSRLAYELLPDFAALPRPPKVVVQLHVEEQDRSGYVRLVCQRYGNLVHAFSVTSDHLAEAVHGYDVPRSKIHVIRTGVDAEQEFAPDRVTPVKLPAGRVHVLYPGRLVDQKDPLLMVEVLRRVAATRPEVLLHVVGFGPLEEQVRVAIREHDLDGHVAFHPPTTELARWFAAADVLLMTSLFEGVPYVAYEAMAMGVPVVAPALPGNVELLRGGGGALIEPRDDTAAYCTVLERLIASRPDRVQMGAAGRRRALGELSVREMARRHEALYDRLVSARPPRAPEPNAVPADPPRLERASYARPLVSIVTPCFNHGRFLLACVDAVRQQTYDQIEMIVVDDASTDTDTLAVLDELEASGFVRLIRLSENRGPSGARNVGLDAISGAYVLPVDADNLLLPEAVSQLVSQLNEAHDRVAFIYPSFHFFGNRRERFDAPAFNRVELLDRNYCDTASLFDARVFTDCGIRFAEDIRLGHEDWDLVLQIVGRGLEGRPSNAPVMYYRKTGFTRSDEVDHQNEVFGHAVRRRHPELYGDVPESPHIGWNGWHRSPTVDIKARWSPGLTIALLEPLELASEAGQALRARLAAQTTRDVEVLVRSVGEWPADARAPHVRRIPVALAPNRARALQDLLVAARSRYVLVFERDAVQALADPAFVEKVLRTHVQGPASQVTAYCDAGLAPGLEHRLLSPGETAGRDAHAVLLRRGADAPPPLGALSVDAQAPVASLVAALNSHHGLNIAWRCLPGGGPSRLPGGATVPLKLEPPDLRQTGAPFEREMRFQRHPILPEMPWDQVRRWLVREHWVPPLTRLLVRHRSCAGEDWRVTTELEPPPGYSRDRVLGSIHLFQPPGTAQLHAGGPQGFYVLPDEDKGAPIPREPVRPSFLGSLEQTPFLLLVPILLAYHRRADRHVLLNGDDDPLRAHVEVIAHLGWAEPYPLLPRTPDALPRHGHGFLPLVRSVDHTSRRHRYALGRPAAGEVSLELGSLHTDPQPGSIPVWVEDDTVVTATVPRSAPAETARRLRWAVAPLAWRRSGFSPRVRMRATARRALTVPRLPITSVPLPPGRAPDGYLWAASGAGRRPIYAAVHPVTGDQLVTISRVEPADLGYVDVTLLGYVSVGMSLTGHFDPRRVDILWAFRFGRTARHYDPVLPEA